MKHQTLEQLHAVAEVQPTPAPLGMTRNQRLERWSELLTRDPKRMLTTLEGTEHRPMRTRVSMRAEGSPITVAFQDDVLREEGLANDSYGEAKRFFELTDNELHEIVCSCHVGATMQASRAAHRVRGAIRGGSVMQRLRRVLGIHP
ncbi:hypothetical protein [Aquamicrobium soli]|uniref:Uncharacterized protein n=1 Tax=Aquamicrobium soli TaxID=1811518 RepID=A0ABV7K353_9HYPH